MASTYPSDVLGLPTPRPNHPCSAQVLNSKLPFLEGTSQVTFLSALTHPTETLCF